MRAALLLPLALLLAGCVAPSPSSPSAAEPPLWLRLEDCTNVGGLFSVPAAQAQAFLPAGFEARPSPRYPGQVQLFVEGMRCARAVLPSGEVGQADALYAELEVKPPAELQREGEDDYTIPVFFRASPAPVAALFQAWRVAGAELADVAREPTTTPAAEVVRYTARTNASTVELTVTMAEPLTQASAPVLVRQFGVQDKVVRTVIDVDVSDGACTLGAVQASVEGDAPLLRDAEPAATGGRCAGYALDLRLTSFPASPS